MSNNFSVTITGYVKEEFSLIIFFCVYMDDLSNKVNNVNAGCIIGSSLINHYAQGNALIRKFYMCTESVKCTLFKSYTVLRYIHASCGVAIEQSQ